MKLTTKQIERLVKQGEVVHTECKDASGGLPDSLWESYSAFANTDGGVILFGAKEVDGKFSIADYHGRQGIVIEKKFNEIKVSNPGTMRISKEIAIEGGRSDPRNAQVFNIFSLIGIGERSGTGLSNLYALWEQHGFATPVIREEFDPEKTVVNIATEPNQSVSANTRTELDHIPDKSRTKPVQGAPQADLWADNKLDNKLDNKIDNKSDLMSSIDNIQTIKDCSGLNSSARRVFGAIVEDPFMTQQGLSAKLDLSRATIATATATLIKHNFIRRAGSKKTGHWEVVK